mmetsp:Transcript_152475/g.489021  ORF Transcript_152475/g.489021 Transcript_152475/m.489021 type:complete len:217 (-) Transcript_152475:235-885(-)
MALADDIAELVIIVLAIELEKPVVPPWSGHWIRADIHPERIAPSRHKTSDPSERDRRHIAHPIAHRDHPCRWSCPRGQILVERPQIKSAEDVRHGSDCSTIFGEDVALRTIHHKRLRDWQCLPCSRCGHRRSPLTDGPVDDEEEDKLVGLLRTIVPANHGPLLHCEIRQCRLGQLSDNREALRDCPLIRRPPLRVGRLERRELPALLKTATCGCST